MKRHIRAVLLLLLTSSAAASAQTALSDTSSAGFLGVPWHASRADAIAILSARAGMRRIDTSNAKEVGLQGDGVWGRNYATAYFGFEGDRMVKGTMWFDSDDMDRGKVLYAGTVRKLSAIYGPAEKSRTDDPADWEVHKGAGNGSRWSSALRYDDSAEFSTLLVVHGPPVRR